MRKIESISIKKYIEISELISESMSLSDRVKVICKVSECTEEEVRLIPLSILDNIWDEFVKNTFDLGDGSVDAIVTIDGNAYGLMNLKNLTVGEMADMDVLKNHPIPNQNLHKIMAILYRPLKSKLPFRIEEYSTEGFDERAEIFLHKMPIKVALNSAVFFLSTLNKLSGITKDFSESQTKTRMTLKERMLRRLGVGIVYFTFYAKTIFYKWKMLLK